VVVRQGYRTGYVYREPPVPEAEEGKQVPHSEVVVPPTVSSYTYSFEEDTGREATYVVTSCCFLQCCMKYRPCAKILKQGLLCETLIEDLQKYNQIDTEMKQNEIVVLHISLFIVFSMYFRTVG